MHHTAANVPQRYRAIWISDVHLGTRGCKAELLLEFLRDTESDYLYLVGDIVDGWRLRRSWYWPQSHNDVVQKLLRKARKGTRVIFVPGNHDEFARGYTGHAFGGIPVTREARHTGVDGRTYLVLHGDEFDGIVRHARWLVLLGDSAYTLALMVNQGFNHIRRRLGLPYWSLSAFLKRKVKNAVRYIASFEIAMADFARRHDVDGIICGHIHHPEMREINGVDYFNDGDWIEHCSALVEHFDGRMEIVLWPERRNTGRGSPPE